MTQRPTSVSSGRSLCPPSNRDSSTSTNWIVWTDAGAGRMR